MIHNNTQKDGKELNERSWILSTFRNIAVLTLYTLLIIILTRVIIMNAYVPSGSMENTLNVGDLLIGDRLAKTYRRGDILVFTRGNDNLVKRLIGLPGEHVEIKNNNVFINGKELEEPYIKEEMNTNDRTFDVPEGEYLFLGDNRNNSLDARFWDYPYIMENNIKAKIVFRIWPLDKQCVFLSQRNKSKYESN